MLEEISRKLKQECLTPEELSDLELKLAGEFGLVSLRLLEVVNLKAEDYPKMAEYSGVWFCYSF